MNPIVNEQTVIVAKNKDEKKIAEQVKDLYVAKNKSAELLKKIKEIQDDLKSLAVDGEYEFKDNKYSLSIKTMMSTRDDWSTLDDMKYDALQKIIKKVKEVTGKDMTVELSPIINAIQPGEKEVFTQRVNVKETK